MESTNISSTEQNFVEYVEHGANFFDNMKRKLNQAYKKHLKELDSLQTQYNQLDIFQQIQQAFIVEVKCIKEGHFENEKTEKKNNNGGIDIYNQYRFVRGNYDQILNQLNIKINQDSNIGDFLHLLATKNLESDKSKEILEQLENDIKQSNAGINQDELNTLMEKIKTTLSKLVVHVKGVLNLEFEMTTKKAYRKMKEEKEDAKKQKEGAKKASEELLKEDQKMKINNKSNKGNNKGKKKKTKTSKQEHEEKKKKREGEIQMKIKEEERQKKAEKYENGARKIYNVLDNRQNKNEISLDKNGIEANLKKIKALYTWKNNTEIRKIRENNNAEICKIRENNAIKTLVKLKQNKEQQQMIKSFYGWKNKTEKLKLKDTLENKLKDVKTELENLREKNTKVTKQLSQNTKKYNKLEKESNNFNKTFNAKTKELKEIQNKFNKLNVEYSRISDENSQKTTIIDKQRKIIGNLQKQNMDNITEKSQLENELQSANIKLDKITACNEWLYQDCESLQKENNQLKAVINEYQVCHYLNPPMAFITNGYGQQHSANFNLKNYQKKGNFYNGKK